MSQILAEVTRGEVVESVHRIHVAVVDNIGNILYSHGDPYKFTYMRSSAKPLQALEVVLSGAYKHFNLTEKELAIICSSHCGEPIHVEVIESILKKLNLTKDYFKCGAVLPWGVKANEDVLRNNSPVSPLYNDCSGKHSGMLSVCVLKNYPKENYLSPDHPLQKNNLETMNLFSGFNDIKIGIDGCSAPVFALPISNMALAYARFTNNKDISTEYSDATDIISNAMMNYPEMLAGTNGFCTELIKNTNKKLIGKIGAEGVYCIGIKDQNIGIALKVEDGNMRAVPPAAMFVLKELNLLSDVERKNLSRFEFPDVTNDVGTIVGKINMKIE